MADLVLASRSPRRREILGWLGIPHTIVEPEVEELGEGLSPTELVVENARRKAAAGAGLSPAGSLVLGADTDVFVEGSALGKPADRAGAEARLRELSGHWHDVVSGVCLVGPRDGEERSASATTRVRFADLSEKRIVAYLDSAEWKGRAGAYAIQGLGSVLVTAVEGDFSNVVGLPIGTLLELEPALGAGMRDNSKAKK